MAKGNYGVTTFSGETGGGGSSGSGGGGGGRSRGKGFSHIDRTFAKGGFMPEVFEHGATGTGKGVKSISEMTTRDHSTGSDIASSFRKSKKR